MNFVTADYIDTQTRDVKGNYGNYTYLVGKEKYYKPYIVAVKAYNSLGDGPISPSVQIMSSMRCTHIHLYFAFS